MSTTPSSHPAPGGRQTVPSSATCETQRLHVVDGDLYLEDAVVEVRAFPGVVYAGLGSTCYAHRGVTVVPSDGAVVHLAPGALVEELPAGALERAEVTVTPWAETRHQAPRAAGVVDVRQ